MAAFVDHVARLDELPVELRAVMEEIYDPEVEIRPQRQEVNRPPGSRRAQHEPALALPGLVWCVQAKASRLVSALRPAERAALVDFARRVGGVAMLAYRPSRVRVELVEVAA